MPNRRPSKQRLEELIALARTYRGWSSRDLARELGRDVHHLVPDSGVPKLDIVIALAEALDWTVQDVVDDLCGNVPAAPKEPSKPRSSTPPESNSESSPDTESFPALNRAAWDALQGGEYERAVLIARRAYFAATTPNERATASLREFGAWGGLGRYQLAMECVQRGLADGPTDDGIIGPLRTNLAYCHYLLGHLAEAVGVATALLVELDSPDWRPPAHDPSRAFALFYRGAALRAMIVAGSSMRESLKRQAIDDLDRARAMLTRSAEELSAPAYLGAALTAEGALLTLRALTDESPVSDVLSTTMSQLDEVIDPSQYPDRHALEAIGWWCVFGCEMAVARIPDDDERQRVLGILTNKVDEISRKVGNWALRERVWRLEVLRRLEHGTTAPVEPWVIDSDDARELTGAMARFPQFRSIGWQVFRGAEIGPTP